MRTDEPTNYLKYFTVPAKLSSLAASLCMFLSLYAICFYRLLPEEAVIVRCPVSGVKFYSVEWGLQAWPF